VDVFESDAIKVSSIIGFPRPEVRVRGNFVSRPTSIGTDLFNPHADAVEVNANANPEGQWGGLFEFNILYEGDTRGGFQGIFTNNQNNVLGPGIVIRANAISNSGTSVLNVIGPEARVYFNSISWRTDAAGVGFGSSPRTELKVDAYYQKNISRVSSAFSNAALDFGNFAWTNETDQADVFAGLGGVAPFRITTLAEMFTALAPGPSADADAGAFGSAVNWTTRTIDESGLQPWPNDTPAVTIIGLMGQSDFEFLVDNSSFQISNQPFPTITNPNCSVVNADEPANTVTENAITDANIALNKVNLAMATLAAFCGWKYPTRQFVFLDLAVSGTARSYLYDDSDTRREWTDFQRVLDYSAATYGKDPDLIVEHWYAGDSGFLKSFGSHFAPFYIGQNFDGSPFTLGSLSTAGGAVDHVLWDAEVAPNLKGRGVFTREKTKLLLHRRQNYLGQYTNWAGDHAGLEAFVADPRVPSLGIMASPPAFARFDALVGLGGWHAEINDPDGQPGWARHIMEGVTRLIDGTDTIKYPKVSAIELGGIDNLAHADVVVDLPNGGNLSTFLAEEGRTFDVALQLRQPVVGAEIRRNGDTADQRQPVWPAAEVGKPAAYRGAVAIVDPGSGVPRRGRIRITPEVPFAVGDRVYFNWLNGNVVPGGTIRPNGDALKPWMGYPLETVPGMRDAATTYPFTGVPVGFFPTPKLVGGLDLPEPTVFWTQGSPAGTAWQNPTFPTPEPTRLVFTTRVRIPSSALPLASGNNYLAGQGGTSFNVAIKHTTRQVFMLAAEMKDSLGAALLGADVNLFVMPLDEWVHLRVDLNLLDTTAGPNGTLRAEVDGIPIALVALNANSGALAAAFNRRLIFMARTAAATPVGSFWPGCNVEFAQFEIDNGAGLTLMKRLEGDAATVNADPWKAGGTAV